jgi:hypothetical protein
MNRKVYKGVDIKKLQELAKLVYGMKQGSAITLETEDRLLVLECTNEFKKG